MSFTALTNLLNEALESGNIISIEMSDADSCAVFVACIEKVETEKDYVFVYQNWGDETPIVTLKLPPQLNCEKFFTEEGTEYGLETKTFFINFIISNQKIL